MNGFSGHRRSKTQMHSKGVVDLLEPRNYLSAVSFAAPISQATSLVGAGIMADFNGDSKADLVSSDPAGNVDVSLSNGDGTFAAPIAIAVLGAPASLAVGRFDTTGNLDIVAGTIGSPGSVSIIVGNGDGTFLPANDIAALDTNSSIVTGDFNNDGKQDVLTVSNSAAPSGNAMLLLGNGTAGAFSQTPFNLPFGSVSSVAAGDFNGDGNLDFVVADNANNSVSVLAGNGDGTFQAAATYATGAEPTAVIAANVTGKTLSNGKPQLDIITAGGTGGVSYLANHGDGNFAAAVTSATGTTALASLSTADFNKDGRPDLFAVQSGVSISGLALLGAGDGTFTLSNTVSIGMPLGGGAVGDVNADGLSDVVGVTGGRLSSQLDAYTVGSTGSSVSVTAAALSVNAGIADVLTAAITPANATGTVNFMASNVSIGTANVIGGVATLSASLNTPGNTVITATYSGDSTYAPSSASSITVMVAGAPVGAQPLIPVIQRSTLPAALVGGLPAHGSVISLVTNSTGAAISGFITTNIYASTNGVVNADSILIGTLKKKLTVKAGGNFTVSVSVKLLASTLPVANYRLLAQTLDPANAPSTSATGPNLNVAAPFVTLTESFTKLAIAQAVVAGSKSSSVALVRITNSGNIISSGVTPVVLYVSPDGTPGAGTALNSIRKKLVIGVGRSVTVAIPLKAIVNVAAGEYSVGVQVTDPATAGLSYGVSSSTINIGAATVDFSSTLVTVPAKASIGKKMSVVLDVTNNGNVAAKGKLQISFASSATSDGVNATVLSTSTVSINLQPGRKQRLRLGVLVPLNAILGANYLVATIDPGNAYSDPNLVNNVSVSAAPITFG